MVERAMLVPVPEGFMDKASGSSTFMRKGLEGKMEEKERSEGRGRVKSTSVLRLREEVWVEVEKRSKAARVCVCGRESESEKGVCVILAQFNHSHLLQAKSRLILD